MSKASAETQQTKDNAATPEDGSKTAYALFTLAGLAFAFLVIAVGYCWWTCPRPKPKKTSADEEQHYVWNDVRLYLAIARAITVIGGSLGLGIRAYFANRTDSGTFGDTFGVVNAWFSGLALAGVVVALMMQSREMFEQRQEMEKTSESLFNSAYLNAFSNYLAVAPEAEKDNLAAILRTLLEVLQPKIKYLEGQESLIAENRRKLKATSWIRRFLVINATIDKVDHTQHTFAVTHESLSRDNDMLRDCARQLAVLADELAQTCAIKGEVESIRLECEELKSQSSWIKDRRKRLRELKTHLSSLVEQLEDYRHKDLHFIEPGQTI